MTVKTNLKQILADRKLSIRQLAEQTGIGFESVRKMANNDMIQYQRDTLYKICLFLDIEINDLLYIEKETAEADK